MNDQIFNVAIATKYGLLEAIIIRHLQTCLNEKKANNEPRELDDKYWMELSEWMYPILFPYAKKEEIDGVIANLTHRKVIRGAISTFDEEYFSFVDEEKWLK